MQQNIYFHTTPTTAISTLSLHDALPICHCVMPANAAELLAAAVSLLVKAPSKSVTPSMKSITKNGRSEEHTSELQSQSNLVCRLLLEKKNHSCSKIPMCTHNTKRQWQI